MSQLKVGFARVDVTPMMGILMEGYYSDREAEGVLDPLQVVALALAEGDNKALMLTIDNCVLWPDVAEAYKKHICETTGVPENIIAP